MINGKKSEVKESCCEMDEELFMEWQLFFCISLFGMETTFSGCGTVETGVK